MSKEKTLRTLEETEVMQATGVPAQETEESKHSSCNRDYRRSQETAGGSKGRSERVGRKLEYVS